MEELQKDIMLCEFMNELKHRSVLIQIIDNLKEIIFDEAGTVENLVLYRSNLSRKIGVVIPFLNPRNRLVFKIYLRSEE